MKHKSTKIMSPTAMLNKNLSVSTSLIRRFVRIDYPVYGVPVEITERTSETYEEIERSMADLLYRTEIQSRIGLFTTLGIAEYTDLSNNVLDYLISIGHIDEAGESLKITQLGIESLIANRKIKVERSARLIYFDALSLRPLPASFYDPTESMFLSPVDNPCWHANMVDFWEELPLSHIQDLLNLNGQERLEYNIPQEMIDVAITTEAFGDSYEAAMEKGIIHFVPLYLAVFDEIDSFHAKFGRPDIGKLNIQTFRAVSGTRDTFFEGLVKRHLPRLTGIFSPLFAPFAALDNELKFWNGDCREHLHNSKWELMQDGNFLLTIGGQDVDAWIQSGANKPLRDLAENAIIIPNDPKQRGRYIRLTASGQVIGKAISAVLEITREKMLEQEKSLPFIKRELMKMKQQFQTAWTDSGKEVTDA